MSTFTTWNHSDNIDTSSNNPANTVGRPQYNHPNLTHNNSYPRAQNMSSNSSNPNQLSQQRGQPSIPPSSSGSSSSPPGSSDPTTTTATTIGGEGNTDQSLSNRRYNRRIVSNTKRAEQNRNAQKAFRGRREKYIKDLEAKSKEVDQLKNDIQNLEAKNRALTDYICELQRQMLHTTNRNDPSNPNSSGTNTNDIINANSIGGGNAGIHNASNVP